MKIELKRRYLSGMDASTDLQAGGLFFCIIYQRCLQFFEHGKVELTNKIVDAFRPMDPADVEMLENFKLVGKYWFNERGYLVCEFSDVSLTYTGLATEKNADILAFHIYNNSRKSSGSAVYKLED